MKVGVSERRPGYGGVTAAKVLRPQADDGATEAASDSSQVFCTVVLVLS